MFIKMSSQTTFAVDKYLTVLHHVYLEFSVTNFQMIQEFGTYIVVAYIYDTKQQVTIYRWHRELCRLY